MKKEDEDPMNPPMHDRDMIGRETEYDSTMVGQLIRAARKEVGMTQKELALVCNIDESSISDIENGKVEPRIETVWKIVRQGLGGTLYLSIRL